MIVQFGVKSCFSYQDGILLISLVAFMLDEQDFSLYH